MKGKAISIIEGDEPLVNWSKSRANLPVSTTHKKLYEKTNLNIKKGLYVATLMYYEEAGGGHSYHYVYLNGSIVISTWESNGYIPHTLTGLIWIPNDIVNGSFVYEVWSNDTSQINGYVCNRLLLSRIDIPK